MSTTTTTSPPTLLAELRAGSHDAFTSLNSTYRPMVIGVARRCGLSHHDAEDVAQTTFTAAYRGIGAVTEPAAVASWLRTTARREAWRVSGSKHHRLERLAPIATSAGIPEPDEAMIRLEARQLVAAAMRTLSPRDQLVLSLTVTADPPIPYVEIAERLGCAIGSIGVFRRRALDRLERALASGRTRRDLASDGA